MKAECKEWILVPGNPVPLQNRQAWNRVPSSHYREFMAKTDGETIPTISGYGAAIRTRYMVRINSRWRRVYCAQFGNSGTLYIGKPGKWEWTVEGFTE